MEDRACCVNSLLLSVLGSLLNVSRMSSTDEYNRFGRDFRHFKRTRATITFSPPMPPIVGMQILFHGRQSNATQLTVCDRAVHSTAPSSSLPPETNEIIIEQIQQEPRLRFPRRPETRTNYAGVSEIVRYPTAVVCVFSRAHEQCSGNLTQPQRHG